jgi:hypothetical protein
MLHQQQGLTVMPRQPVVVAQVVCRFKPHRKCLRLSSYGWGENWTSGMGWRGGACTVALAV